MAELQTSTVTLTINGTTFTGAGRTRLEALANAAPIRHVDQEQPDTEERDAERYARATEQIVASRQRAADALARGDLRAFFAAGAETARLTNARAAIVEAACFPITQQEVPTLAAA